MISFIPSALSAIFAFAVAHKNRRNPTWWIIGCFFFPPLINTVIQISQITLPSARTLIVPISLRLFATIVVIAILLVPAEHFTHSMLLRELDAFIMSVFLPIQTEISSNSLLVSFNGQKFEVSSAGEKALAAATAGFILGCTFISRWAFFAIAFSLIGFCLGMLSRTASILSSIYIGVFPPHQILYMVILLILFALSIIISFLRARPENPTPKDPLSNISIPNSDPY